METLKTKLEKALMDALRAKDDLHKRTIRMALAAIKFSEKEKKVALEDDSIIAILQKEVKNRQETIQDAKRANREDIVADNEAEIKVLEGFLPQPLSHEELSAMIKGAIIEVDAKSPSDMKKIMQVLLPRIQGKASGNQVSQIVKELLQQGH